MQWLLGERFLPVVSTVWSHHDGAFGNSCARLQCKSWMPLSILNSKDLLLRPLSAFHGRNRLHLQRTLIEKIFFGWEWGTYVYLTDTIAESLAINFSRSTTFRYGAESGPHSRDFLVRQIIVKRNMTSLRSNINTQSLFTSLTKIWSHFVLCARGSRVLL